MITTPTSTPSPSPEEAPPGRTRGIVIFLAMAFGIAWALDGLIALSGGIRGNTALPLLVLAMFVPGLSSVAARRITRDGWNDAGLRLGQLPYYPIAWAVIVALVAATAAVTWLAWPGLLDLSVLSQTQALPIPWPIVAVAAATVAPLFNALPAFGEELGWRGYLLPKLLSLGELRACLASGTIWGLWHAPLIVQGYDFPRHPVAGVPIMAVSCALLGTVLGWLRLRSGSVLPAALAHGTVNALLGIPLVIMPQVDTAYAGFILSMMGWLSMTLVVLALLGLRQFRHGHPVPHPR